MNFGPEYIKKLIADAHALLEREEIDAAGKAAIEDCLKSIQDYEKANKTKSIEATG